MNYSYKKFLTLKRSQAKEIKANILSNSMEPWLRVDDQVTAKLIDYKEIEPFDIILFWRRDIFICHVFLKMEGDFLLTKPLRGNKMDPPIHKSHFLGVVIDPKFSWFHKLILKLTTKKIL